MVFEKRLFLYFFLFLEFCFHKTIMAPSPCMQVLVPKHYVPDRACRPERKTSPNTDKTKTVPALIPHGAGTDRAAENDET